ncbi:UNVERIFIED_CONTAM: hypothetical protein Sangu_2235700 [Sesamum angustifolium]|uniref:Uncharacterized protein n=1 Tax=Sesamum angustifolium TaxID=2727405 RepID=A0AAW2L775_9LAMI
MLSTVGNTFFGSATVASDSYTADKRLGYVELAPGVELYLCSPIIRLTDMLNKHVTKDRPETHNAIKNGLIGVVVWRSAYISNIISPNSLSHHKHSSKKHLFSAPKMAQHLSNVNASTPTRTSPHVSTKSLPQAKEDDDIPPGFDPLATARLAKHDDDLPEFNFSGNINASVPRTSPQNFHHVTKLTPSCRSSDRTY